MPGRRGLAWLLVPVAVLGMSGTALADSADPNPTPLWQAHPLGTQPLATNPAPATTTSGGASTHPRTTTGSAGGGSGADGVAPAEQDARPVASRSNHARQPTAAIASPGGQGKWGIIVIVVGAGVVTLALAPFILEGRPRATDGETAEPAEQRQGNDGSPPRSRLAPTSFEGGAGDEHRSDDRVDRRPAEPGSAVAGQGRPRQQAPFTPNEGRGPSGS